MIRKLRIDAPWWFWLFVAQLCFWSGYCIRGARGLTLTPIFPTVALPYTEAQLWIGDRMFRWVQPDSAHLRYCLGGGGPGGWGPLFGPVAAAGLGTLTPTISMPVGGAIVWKFETYTLGALQEIRTGTKSGAAFASVDNVAALWCMGGPGTAYPVGCGVFDRDSDGDVDMRDVNR